MHDFRAKLAAKQMEFGVYTLRKKKGMKLNLKFTILFVYKCFSTTKSYKFVSFC